jgi:16S rRNA (cytosine1402-N4)-methyltransferase
MSTTFDLKNAICKVLPYENYSKLSIVFQVIRILVNDEINTIKSTLKQTVNYLRAGGRIAAISFHSIEDRIVKHFFKDQTIYKNSSYDIEYKDSNSKIKVITKKPIVESSKKIHENPRSRSAKLRVAERLA